MIVIKQNLTLDKNQDEVQSLTMVILLSLLAQLERVMISQRTKEALAAKKTQGITFLNYYSSARKLREAAVKMNARNSKAKESPNA